jgi:SNF2 family DNA or RNA helicase
MNNNEKQKSVDSFQDSSKTVAFIGNIISAGVGITLTEGNIVIFNSFDWVPGNNEQCEDRAFRIGQENNVTVYYQLFKDSISEKMWGVLQKKQEVIDTVLGEKDYNEAEITELMMDLMLEE